MKILITIAVATLGGLIGYKLKIPAGGLIGAMISVALYNILSSQAYIPYNFKVIAQILAGGIIGLSFTKETILNLKTIIVPVFIAVLAMMVFSVVVGLLLYKFTDLDLVTALFCMAPGGINDMTLAAQDLNGVVSTIAVFHFVRLSAVVGLMPTIIKALAARM